MTEMQYAMRIIHATKPTCIMQINYPIHQGKPNPAHGMFFFVGSVPLACCDEQRKSKKYPTEQAAIEAAVAAGATRIQRADCSFVEVAR